MIVYGKHTARVKGVETFAKTLDDVVGVNKVFVNNVRTRKVGAGKKGEPTLRCRRNHIDVFYSNDGCIQVLRVYPQKVVPTEELCRRLKRTLGKVEERRGGERPNDPVVIPDHIRRLQLAPITKPTAATRDVPTVPPEPASTLTTTNEDPVTPNQSKVFQLTPLQTKVYEFLLSLDPSGQLEFTVDRLFGQVRDNCAGLSESQVSSLVSGLKAKGLIVPGPKITSGYAAQKTFRVLRRPYQTVATPKPTTPPPARPEPPSPGIDTLEETLRFFRKHQAVLEEAEQRRKALAKKGYMIVLHNGRPAIVPK